MLYMADGTYRVGGSWRDTLRDHRLIRFKE
jgi:hypothetical protein